MTELLAYVIPAYYLMASTSNLYANIEQILLEAQHRWLRPAEICEILSNYQKFRIAPEPPTGPPSGSLFLFDRKVLRYFRKDGHNWRKKKDGKTVKEAHEKLKSGSIDVLHCYYAHGEENENFQRRSYWLLEESQSNIVLVHYREVKVLGNRMNSSRARAPQSAIPVFQQSEEDGRSFSDVGSTVSSKLRPYDYQVTSHVTDTTSLNSGQASEYEDVESVYNQQSTSGVHSFTEFQSNMIPKAEDGLSAPYYPAPFSNDQQGYYPAISGMDFPSITHGNQNRNTANAYMPSRDLDFPSWENVSEKNTADYQSVQFQPSISSAQSVAINTINGQGSAMIGFTNDFSIKQEADNHFHALEEWQASNDNSLQSSEWSVDQKMEPHQTFDFASKLDKEKHAEFHDYLEAYNILHTEPDKHPMQNGRFVKAESDGSFNVDGKTDHLAFKQPLLGGVLRQGLTKLDSFDRWISKELEDVKAPNMQSSSQSYWENVGNEDGVAESAIASQAQLDPYVLSPSLSQDQLFSIIDFSPTWAYAGTEIKVLITGRFLKSYQEVEKYNWACMFGELEVPAEIIRDGVLRCHTPFQKAGRVPFYITCSNRLACSEVREFEFRVSEAQDGTSSGSSGGSSESLLHMRFVRMLSLGSSSSLNSVPRNVDDISHIIRKINSLLQEDCEWENMMQLSSDDTFLREKTKDQLLQKLLKDNLRNWLLQKVAEGGKGANVLDEAGQGVLHFAAALGYDWAVPPTLAAGVNVNFRDANGWTALHWAAFYGRERMVGCLISLGAAPGALTDPTPQHPSGRTPADLASSSGHKGIAGYLAESALSTHLSLLKLKENREDESAVVSGLTAVQMASERVATPVGDGDWPDGPSMKDSLAAVRNATQAAARIHQVYRVESFQRKQIKEYGDGGEFGLPDERALSLRAVKNRAGHYDEPTNAAAIRIQNKFRSYKGRKEFLQIRQQIIKIQAHVRGHQVRKNYGKIIWSVGILEKVILRWRRKGSGLRGFKPETVTEPSSMQAQPVQEDEFDFLKEGRKQTEERLQKALARVRSMVQYPEARDQYRRLLNVVSEMKETKKKYDGDPSNSGEVGDFDEDLIDLGSLLDDDTYMLDDFDVNQMKM
nr:calmodulin-binding transcription activator 3-like isoform X1 [Ipomoea batatas]